MFKKKLDFDSVKQNNRVIREMWKILCIPH